MSIGGVEETNILLKVISNFSQNKIESKREEFKTSAVINNVNLYNLLVQTRALNY